MAIVFVEQHPRTGRLVEFLDGLTVGRSGCDVLLVDPGASRRHARLREHPVRGPQVEDLGSRNGTTVNGRRISAPFGLAPGDVVRFGNTVWAVQDRRA